MQENNLEKKESTPASKMSFLVHPGYLDSFGSTHPITEDEKPEGWGEFMRSVYLDYARRLADNEIMVLIPPISKNTSKRKQIELHRSTGDLYTKIIEELKGILGPRLLVITDPNWTADEEDEKDFSFIDRLIGMAEARGFSVDTNTIDVDVGGEVAEFCPAGFMKRLSDSGRFGKEVTYNLEISDMPHRGNKDEKK
jgi:hypothetical protein